MNNENMTNEELEDLNEEVLKENSDTSISSNDKEKTKEQIEMSNYVQSLSDDEKLRAIEAILFAAGHPMSYSKLAALFEMPVWDLKHLIYSYAEWYNDDSNNRGVMLLTMDNYCQLCTKAQYINLIRAALGIRKGSGTLSGSTIETLTIIAYQQPTTRAYIDAVRNSDSSYAMTNLLERGLIEPKGRKDAPGRPIIYGTTPAFLRCFGLNSLADLPKAEGEAKEIFEAVNTRLNLDNKDQMTFDEVIGQSVPDENEDQSLSQDDETIN